MPGAGFISDLSTSSAVAPTCIPSNTYPIVPFSPHGPSSPRLTAQPRLIGRASTVLFVPKDASPDSNPTHFRGRQASNIPPNTHYVDSTAPDTIVVMSQPAGQKCAVLGGIMALRMKTRGALGVVVGGRIRDLTELRALELPVCCAGPLPMKPRRGS